jgi:hypothetical protein
VSFPASEYALIHATHELHVISQLEDLMRDHQIDYRVRGSRNPSGMDLAQVVNRVSLDVAHAQVDEAKALLAAYFAPIDPDSPDLPEELRPDPDEDADD